MVDLDAGTELFQLCNQIASSQQSVDIYEDEIAGLPEHIQEFILRHITPQSSEQGKCQLSGRIVTPTKF